MDIVTSMAPSNPMLVLPNSPKIKIMKSRKAKAQFHQAR